MITDTTMISTALTTWISVVAPLLWQLPALAARAAVWPAARSAVRLATTGRVSGEGCVGVPAVRYVVRRRAALVSVLVGEIRPERHEP